MGPLAAILPLALSLAAPSQASRLDAALVPAFRAIRAGRHEEARAGLDAYLGKPGAAHAGQAEFLLGLSYHEQHLYASAREHFARARALEPGYALTGFFYGFALFNLGRLEDARRELEAYAALAPDDPETRFGLGLVALEQDRVEDAEAAFGRAIALGEARAKGGPASANLREDLARYRARLADVYVRRGELAKAREALERSVALWPDHFEPWHKLAWVLERQGDPEGAARAELKSQEALHRRARTP